IDWSDLYRAKSANDACELLYERLYSVFDVHIPKRIRRQTCDYPMWYTPDLIKKIKDKRKWWRLYTKSKLRFYLNKVNCLRREIKSEARSAYNQYLKSVESDIQSDPKKIWTYIRDKRKVRGLPASMHHDGTDLNTANDIINAFASYFGSVYVEDTSNNSCDT